MGSGPGACPGLFMKIIMQGGGYVLCVGLKIIMQGGGYVLCVGRGFGCCFLLLPVACSFLPSVLSFCRAAGMIMKITCQYP